MEKVRCLVIGNNPEEILSKYMKDREVEPYIRYTMEDVKKLYESRMDFFKYLADRDRFHEEDYLKMIRDYNKVGIENYYKVIAANWGPIDENGNCISTVNPYGEIEDYTIKPLLKGDTESFTDIESYMKYVSIGLPMELLTGVYDCVKHGVDNEYKENADRIIKQNMFYFDTFDTIDEYIDTHRNKEFDLIATENEFYKVYGNSVEHTIKYFKIIKNFDGNTPITSCEVNNVFN